MTAASRAPIIGSLIHDELDRTDEGHCARVEFLDLEESLAVCGWLQAVHRRERVALGAFVLRPRKDGDKGPHEELFISVDEAIERRNRKQERLCVFVPPGVVDAAVSSLGNAFAPIDGRSLHEGALSRLISDAPSEVADAARRCFARLRGVLSASISARLEFVEALLSRHEQGEDALAGLELWRIGLLPDAAPDFLERLEANGHHALEISRPQRAQAPLRERIQKLGVDESTSLKLQNYFEGRALTDVRAWGRDLTQTQLTLDRWTFADLERTDLRAVSVRSFLEPSGVVRRASGLSQPDGPAGALVAEIGPGKKLGVTWVSDPPNPTNLARWRIEIVPVSGEFDDFTAALPSREVAGDKSTVRLSLDLDPETEELPDTAVWVQVIPLDGTGNQVMDQAGQSISATSEEFYLGEGAESDETATGRLKTVPNLAFGRLQALVEGATKLEEEQPQWVQRGGIDFFSLRVSDRSLLRVGLANPLRHLEELVLSHPRQGGRFFVECEDASIISPLQFVSLEQPAAKHDRWQSFWQTRERFFQRMGKADSRNVLEAAEWTSELANAAVRYAQVYRELVDAIVADGSRMRSDLVDALSIDTLHVRMPGASGTNESALVVLPTHPLRVAWYASYAQLLNRWESALGEMNSSARRRLLSLDLLAGLTPRNAPPFAYWPGIEEPFVFFQNLWFFHGVAFPPNASDPHRRFADVAHVLGAGDASAVDSFRPQLLATHLKEYCALHPYVDRLNLTLVNPDRGGLITDTLEAFLETTYPGPRDDSEDPAGTVTFAVNAFVANADASSLQGLEEVRVLQSEHYRTSGIDPLLPTLEASATKLSTLEENLPAEAHVAIVSDLVQPMVAAVPTVHGNRRGSFSLFGLIARFIPEFLAEQDSISWTYRLNTEDTARLGSHPAGARFGETLTDLHDSLLKAGGAVLRDGTDSIPGLRISLSAAQRRLIDVIHQQSDWVISIDRFFGPDYFDSPSEPYLAQTSRKYLLDYSPEFGDGVAHRMMVTTSWQDEVLQHLASAAEHIGLLPEADTATALLDQLKLASGRLALRTMISEVDDARAASLAVVIAWLRARGRLSQSILVPVNLHGHLLRSQPIQLTGTGGDYCDWMLIALRRNIVEATFISVQWRRGKADFQDLAFEMLLPLERTGRLISSQYFDDARADGALQRSYLSSILRFYFERALRYERFDRSQENTFLEHLARLEKTGLDFRPRYEGFIVTDAPEPVPQFTVGDALFAVLRPADLEVGTGFSRREPLAGPGRPEVLQAGSSETTDQNGENSHSDETIPDDITDEQPDLQPETGASTWEEDAVQGYSGGNDASQALGEVGVAVEVLLGQTVSGDSPIVWKPSIQGSPHLFVLGIPGQGKSWTVARAIGELSRQNVPSLILDFHGQFGGTEGPLAGARQGTVLDARNGLPFSPFELKSDAKDEVDWQANAFAIAEIFGYICKLGDMQRDAVFTAVRDAYRESGFGQPDVSESVAGYPTLQDVLTRIESQERSGRTTNVAARCRPLLELDLFRPPGEPTIDLLSLIRQGLVIDLHRLADLEVLQLAAGAFILRKLYKDMFSWGQADHLRLAVVLDEAHRLSRDVTLPKIMKEGRKFGIVVVVASQGIADFHADVLGNAGTKVIFRMNHPESRKAAGFIRATQGTDLAERLEQLGVGQAYVQTPEMRLGSLVRMAPPGS